MYSGAPTQDDLEQAGVTVDDEVCASPNPDGWYYDQEAKDWRCILWAENWPAIGFYYDILRTQWRHGFNGPTGLDYNVLLHELDRRGLSKEEYDDLFASVRLIEAEALKHMRPKE